MEGEEEMEEEKKKVKPLTGTEYKKRQKQTITKARKKECG